MAKISFDCKNISNSNSKLKEFIEISDQIKNNYNQSNSISLDHILLIKKRKKIIYEMFYFLKNEGSFKNILIETCKDTHVDIDDYGFDDSGRFYLNCEYHGEFSYKDFRAFILAGDCPNCLKDMSYMIPYFVYYARSKEKPFFWKIGVTSSLVEDRIGYCISKGLTKIDSLLTNKLSAYKIEADIKRKYKHLLVKECDYKEKWNSIWHKSECFSKDILNGKINY